MKLITVLLLLATLHSAEKPFVFNLSFIEVKNSDIILGEWTLSEKWKGFMGVNIQFTKDEYRYWFYSDVKKGVEPQYPIVGKWKIESGVIKT